MSKKTIPDASPNGQENQPAPSRVSPPPAPENGVGPDPFDPASLRLGQDFGSSVGVKRVITTVPTRRPNRHEFVRIRPGESWRLETACFEDRVNRETYLVERSLWNELSTEIFAVVLFTAITKGNDLFLWPVKLPDANGRSNHWNDSALAAAELAEQRWVRVAANMNAGAYDVFQASADLADPEWPDLSFPELLKLSFKDRFIRDIDHPILRQLRGEV